MASLGMVATVFRCYHSLAFIFCLYMLDLVCTFNKQYAPMDLDYALVKALILKARARVTMEVRLPKPPQGSRGVWPHCDVLCQGSEKPDCKGTWCRINGMPEFGDMLWNSGSVEPETNVPVAAASSLTVSTICSKQ